MDHTASPTELRWVTTSDEKGPWSETASATIGAWELLGFGRSIGLTAQETRIEIEEFQ